MDYFSIGMNWFCLAAQSVMQCLFVLRFTGQRLRAVYLPAFLLLMGGLELFAVGVSLPWGLAIGAQLGVLYSFNRLALHSQRSVAGVAALIAIYISQLSFGLVNSLETVLFPGLIGRLLLYPLLVLATCGALALCAACYYLTLQFLSLPQAGQLPFVGVLLLPQLFFLAAELYILQTSYNSLAVNLTPADLGWHLLLFGLQALGLAALLCTLWAYRGICRGFQTQAQVDLLLQAAQAQKTYLAEAQQRYAKSRSFRHDLKNHLAVLDGLLARGQYAAGRDYLQKLESASLDLEPAYQTGNPAVDVLLAEKLGLAAAEGIETEVELALPQPCAVDDFDLCVIFANALDNACQACREVRGAKSIRIVGERQGDFLRLEFINTCREAEPLPPPGVGLGNIKAVAEKYQGAMLTEKNGGFFCLNVLLNIAD